MGEGKYREEKALERGFLLLAVLVMGAWVLALWLSFRSERNRILDVLTTLYGRTDAARFSALLDGTAHNRIWLLGLFPMGALLGFYLYGKKWLMRLEKEISRFSFCLEQLTAGKDVALAQWKEGLLSSLSNQVELLYRRNCHMIALVQEEKEKICRFMENMVHQMKTPMTALCLDLDLLEGKLEGQEAALGKIQNCQEQCTRLKDTIDEFLLSSRFSAGKVAVIPAPADIDVMVEGVRKELSSLLEKRKISVSYDSQSRKPLFCDSGWMKTAIANLVKNSVESMRAGGTIHLRHWDEDRWKYLELTDEGGGFSEEAGNRIFERFYTGRADKGGTGLGLSIVKEVVEATHGTICASALEKEGKRIGTRFLMKFRILDGPDAYEG